MNRAPGIVLWLSIGLAVVWIVAATSAQGAGGLAVVGLFFFLAPAFLAAFLFGAYTAWKHPAQRGAAIGIMTTPVIAWFTPMLVRSFIGGAANHHQLLLAAASVIVLIFLAAWLLPGRISRLVPDFLLKSRLFNRLLILSLVAAWAFLIVVIGFVLNDTSSSSASSTALAYAVVLGAFYLVGIGAGSLCVATWAWISLRDEHARVVRRLTITQLIVSSPGIVIGGVVLFWLVGQGQL